VQLQKFGHSTRNKLNPNPMREVLGFVWMTKESASKESDMKEC